MSSLKGRSRVKGGFKRQAQGLLPNVSFVDPEFALADDGTGGDDHRKADIRRGERFLADTYHALAGAGYLDNTVLVITFDEWGGFFDHVRPPQVIDDTNPARASWPSPGIRPEPEWQDLPATTGKVTAR